MTISIGEAAGLKPFIAWNRLEGRPRKKDFEQVLKARIHDPLWMLGRQWQMGEFKGNDTGSGILAKVHMDYARISQYAAHQSETFLPFNESMPLEPIVERLNYNWSIKERILMGRKWLQCLSKAGLSLTHYQPLFDGDTVFIYTIDKSAPEESDAEDLILKKAVVHSDIRVSAFFAAAGLKGAVIDGAKIFGQLTNPLLSTELMDNLNSSYAVSYPSSSISGGDASLFAIANNDFKAWVIKMYSLPSSGRVQEYWNQRSMEYQFDIFVPNNDASAENRLSANRYSKGHLDWNVFTQEDGTTYDLSTGAKKETKSLQLIMSSNRFAGMPATRWWEFENGGVNFAKLDADSTDIAKIIMTQFALVYQDDWFNIPYKVPVSSASRIEGIMVTDVFGVRVLVGSHKVKEYKATTKEFVFRNLDWKKWNWMDISLSGNRIGELEPSDRMLILPVADKIQESKPIESVLFMRDEMANLVWGVEKMIPDHLGKGKDAYEAARDFTTYLQNLKPIEEPESSVVESATSNGLKYQIASQNIPENWIPFTAVHTGKNNRSIQLQRASMPRILAPYQTSLVRPLTALLRKGLELTPVEPLFINEEEITRAGTIVETTHQRTRWYNGAIVSWVGRSKKTGKGEGSSGLTFDNIS